MKKRKIKTDKAARTVVKRPNGEIRYSKFSMRVYIILLTVGEMILISLIAQGVTKLLAYFGITTVVPELAWFLIISVALAGAISVLISYFIFRPIAKLGRAMKQVSEGNFKVRLTTKSAFREIQEIYCNFNSMVEELGETEILQNDFVSNVSHEFKTPINAIEGYATLLQDCESGSAEQRAYVEKILRNTGRLSSLVGNILLISKVEHQSLAKNPVIFRLDEQIRQDLLLLEPEWTKKDLEFDVEMESMDYCGNENLLHHVWYNLLSNAIKFSPEHGLIRLTLHREEEGKQAVFAVEDQGPGIPEEAKKHIFDQFYQGDSSHKEEGNGLGLALVRKILLQFNGTVAVESGSDGGSCFTVSLPLDGEPFLKEGKESK